MATPAYAPPEVIRGEKDIPGFKSDMYSFGATLYQLFAGHAPFVHDDPMVVCEMQQENQPPPLIAVNSALPPEISILVDKLMEKDPGKRPGSWSTVLHSLNEITYAWHVTNRNNGEKTASVETGTGKQKLLIGAVVLLSVLFLAELAIFFLLPTPQPQAEKTTVTSVQKQTADPVPLQPTAQPAATAKNMVSTPVQKPVVYQTPQQAKDPLDELEDDPDELKRWKREIKPILPEDPYTRWEALKEYLEDNLYAPKDARKMFRDLEQKEKVAHINKLKKFDELCKKKNATLKIAQELESDIDAAPLWAAEVFTLDDLEAIRKRTEALKEKAEKLNAIRRQQEEQRRKQLEANKLENRIRQAEAELQKIRRMTLSIDAENFQNMVNEYNKKYADLPDYEEYSSRIALFEAIKKMATTSLYDLIHQNQKHLKGLIIFPTHYPTYTFRSAENNNLSFVEKKGSHSIGKKLHATWLEENSRVALEDLFYQCTSQLQDFNKDSLVTLFVIAQCNGFPVRQYLKRYSWLPKRTREEVFMLLNEIHQMQK